jgi:serine phosphatase RsbU (regulator of sigma subunit)
MSDGFPELFNKQKEILDYSRAKVIFGSIGEKSASETIKSLLREVEIWKGEAKQEDDITFVVVKKK